MKFEGTAECVAHPDLTVAVNPASTPERPLRLRGEPGTGSSDPLPQTAAGLALPFERLAFMSRRQG